MVKIILRVIKKKQSLKSKACLSKEEQEKLINNSELGLDKKGGKTKS